MDAETRIRTALTRAGDLDRSLAVIRQDAEVGVPGTVIDGARRFARYPGFRDPTRRLPDSCFDVTTSADWPAKLDVTALAWESDGRRDRVLTITAGTPVPDLAVPGVETLTVNAEEIPAEVATVARGPTGTTLQVRLVVAQLLGASDPTGQRRSLTARVGDARGADQRERRRSRSRAPRAPAASRETTYRPARRAVVRDRSRLGRLRPLDDLGGAADAAADRGGRTRQAAPPRKVNGSSSSVRVLVALT